MFAQRASSALRASVSHAAAARYAGASNSFLAARVTLSMARFYSSKFPDHTVIHMPALSPTMTQGGIMSWSKQVGDELAPGEPIAEIETDKASMDFEFQEEGYLAKILVDAGAQDVPVGKPIAVYVEESGDVAAFESFTAEDAGEGPAPPAQEEAKEEPKEEPKKEDEAPQKPAATAKDSTPSKAPAGRIFASPLAKTIALDKGIALKNIKGSGPNGRIVAKDVEAYKAPAAATSAAPAATGAAVPASYEDIPLTGMRKTIASRLLQSTQQSPTYIVQSQLNVTKLLKLRQSLNATAEDRYKLSVNDLLIKAIALASVRVPQANSAWLAEEGVIRQYNNVDVSVAVATPTGLITPIVKNAHNRGLAAISKEIKELGKKAKAGKLAPEEYQGGTICISNLGMNHAVNAFTSIINPPQSAIVAIGTTDKKAVPSAVNEQGFVFEDVITVTATFDHRVIDGAVGGDWVRELKRIVENPLEFLV
ncbi:pyruvate dehydrogenase complex dihydrolipoamide acetyltransferase [Candidozyma pseudohaemuli]|uniref:Acetyltransferase component of pyruvate dehydrogenase complex n=1 Tax=Candidozyma pseudohaemuli TaxID=418784 RepID=A0A2P7YM67_9ASCO|nr:pyruvate dehydrogenase complex dihydrolipoamide acetyltransferase [[Candida] pseudohaemulonii]PSK37060.1 pyruvate dehydrogenase complex dihydrolipoamide acetyltransferase [[Candida] pseudohaemulonii]